MSGRGRRVPFSHPFFDMNPDEFWSRRYAGMPPEFWSGSGPGSGFNRPSGGPPMSMMSGRPFPASSQASHSVQRRREWSGSGTESAPSQLFDQHFGGDAWPAASGSSTKDDAGDADPHCFYIRKPGFERQISGSSEIQSDDKCFKVSLDVQQFTPDELDVRVVDGEVLIHAKHEQRADEHGYVKREFTRRYTLPDDVDPESVKSSLSQEGVLSIEAPRKLTLEGQKIPIQVEAKSPAPAVEGAAASSEGKK